jgi:hypothetical protein
MNQYKLFYFSILLILVATIVQSMVIVVQDVKNHKSHIFNKKPSVHKTKYITDIIAIIMYFAALIITIYCLAK